MVVGHHEADEGYKGFIFAEEEGEWVRHVCLVASGELVENEELELTKDDSS